MAHAAPLFAQAPEEIESVLAIGVAAPSPEAQHEAGMLWQKITISEKYDRLEARRRLVALGQPLFPIIKNELITDNLEDSRNAALALGRANDLGALDALRAIVDDKSNGSKRHAAMALGLVGDAKDAEVLMKLLRSARQPEIKRAALYALARLGSPADLARLDEEYEADNSQEMRSAILITVGRIGGKNAWKTVAKGLASNKESVRRAAALAAADLRTGESPAAVQARLGDSDTTVVRYTVLGMGLVPRPEVAAIVERLELLKHHDDEVRALAATALGVQETPVALQLLLARAKSGNERQPVVKQAMAFAFARFGNGGAAELAKLLKDGDADVVRAAACASCLGPQATALSGFLPLVDGRQHESVRKLGLLLMARGTPEDAAGWIEKVIAANNDKKDFLEYGAELLGILKRRAARAAILEARFRVVIDDLGGSPEWNLVLATHRQMLVIEHIDHPLSPRGSGVAPGAGSGGDQSRPKQITWNKEEEDMRLWYDLFPYLGRRSPRTE